MPDYYPKTYEELAAENATLRASVSRLEDSVRSLQSTVLARDAEIDRLIKPKRAPHALDPKATDSFARPA